MRINPEDFFDQIGATTEHQLNLKKNMAGYIDWDFDPSNYPNEWPRVILDGQGLSARTYPCLSSYQPMPGDRVILEALGSGHVIIGAVQDTPNRQLLPGTLVFSATSTLAQSVDSGTDVSVIWNNVDLDLLGSWSDQLPAVGGSESGPASDLRHRFSPPIPGWYTLAGGVGWATSNSGWRSAFWVFNGTVLSGGLGRTPSATTNASIVTNARTRCCFFNGSTDYVELTVAHNVTGGLAISNSAAWRPSIDIIYSGPGSLTDPLPSIE